MLIVSSCDEGYFPLVKGLFLSLIPALQRAPDVRLGFVDLGCRQSSLDWIRDHGILIRRPHANIMGALAEERFGNRRAQTCRPFLADFFPEEEFIAWMDADMWVQDIDGLLSIVRSSTDNRNNVFASPEMHFTYTHVGESNVRSAEIYNLNVQFFDHAISTKMSESIVYNSGFFLACAKHPIWSYWRELVREIYLDESRIHSPTALHFAEQVAFNRCIRELGSITQFDPLYNYLCIWTIPFRDSAGVVRLSAPPGLPIGVVHLAGGWRFFGRRYLEAGLLFQGGRYLSPDEHSSITKLVREGGRYARIRAASDPAPAS